MKFHNSTFLSFFLVMPVLLLMACNSQNDKQAEDAKDSKSIGTKGDKVSGPKDISGKWEYMKMTYDKPPASESEIQQRKDDHEQNTGLTFHFNSDKSYSAWNKREEEMNKLGEGSYEIVNDAVIVRGTTTSGRSFTDTTEIVSVDQTQIILHPNHSTIKLYFKRLQ